MSKSKSNGVKTAKPETDTLKKAKSAGVTKSSSKSNPKELAKAMAKKIDPRSKKEKKVREPSPEDSESEDDSASESAESESSGSESDSESEVKSKPIGNGKVKHIAKGAADDSASDSSDSESDESSDERVNRGKKNINGPKPDAADSADEEGSGSDDSDDGSEDETPAKVKAHRAADSDSEAESSESEDSEDDSAPSKPKAKSAVNGAKAAVSRDEDDESDSSADSSEDEVEERKDVGTKKRKAEEEAAPATKKTRAEPATDSENTNTNLFVGNLSWNVDEEWLSREFGDYGELAGVRLITDRDSGRSKGFGYVEYVNPADAAKAYADKKDAFIDNRKINLDWAGQRTNAGGDRQQNRAKSFGDKISPPSDTLFVGNISFDATQDMVAEAFGGYGEIVGVRLPTDRDTGAPKGFGYVNFASIDDAKAAMDAMQGFDLAGRPLRLDFSSPRPSNGDSPGRGRGGFGGGFGGRGGGRGGFGDRGGRGGFGGRGGVRGGFGGRGGRGASTNRGGFGDFSGKKTSFD